MKYLLFFILMFLSFNNVNAYEVENISYGTNLDDKTIVYISWKDFSSCSLTSNWKEISITSQTSTRINFLYSKLGWHSWQLEVNCWWKETKIFYKFPYISNVKFDNVDKTKLIVSWENFNGSNSRFIISWATFDILDISDNTAYLKIKKWWLPKTIYSIVDSKKSNLFEIESIYPEINYIESEDWIIENKEVFLCWNNFKDTDIINFAWKDIKPNEYTLSNSCFKFKAPYSESYKSTVYVYNDYYKSRTINIEYKLETPILKTVSKSNYFYASKKSDVLAFVIEWENFPKLKNEINFYINWTKLNVYEVSQDKAIVEYKNDNVYPWDNFLYAVYWNQIKTNIISYSNNYEYINIANVDYLSEEWDYLKYRISFTWGFEEENYKFYIDTTTTKIFSCWNSYCDILYKWNINKEFTLKTYYKNKKNPKEFIFDSWFEISEPYITYVEFPDWVWANKKIIIHWNNLLSPTTISSSNFFWKKSSGQDNVTYNWKTIVWYFLLDYNEKWKSLINLKSKNYNKSLSFSNNQIIDWKYLYFWPHITKTESEWIWYKKWNIVKVYWENFSPDDVLIYSSTKISLKDLPSLKSQYFEFKLPNDLKDTFSFEIKNSNWFSSNKITLNILKSDFEWLFLEKWNITNLKIIKNKTDNFVLSRYTFYNYIEDLTIDNFEVNISWNSNENFWALSLYIWNQEYSQKIFTDKWTIIFTWVKIPYWKINIDFKKTSPFLESWKKEFKIDFSWSKFKLNDSWIIKTNFINSNVFKESFSVESWDENNCFTNFKNDYCLVEKETTKEELKGVEEDKVSEIENTKEIPLESEQVKNYRSVISDTFMPKFEKYVAKKAWNSKIKIQTLYKKYYAQLSKYVWKFKDEKRATYLDELIIQIKKRMD